MMRGRGGQKVRCEREEEEDVMKRKGRRRNKRGGQEGNKEKEKKGEGKKEIKMRGRR
jgi:hypothetical protein